MLYINNKHFNLDRNISDEFDEYRKDFHNKISWLKDRFGDSITLSLGYEPVRNSSGMLEPIPLATAPLRQVVLGNRGSEEWVYTESIPTVKDGYIVPGTLQEIIRYGELNIDLNDDPDKAYFFLYKHDFIKNGRFRLVDEQAEEERKASLRASQSELEFLIYNPASEFSKDIDKLKLIARRWGVSGVDDLSSAQIKNRLYDIIMSGESRRERDEYSRGIKEFIADCSMDNTVKIGAVVQKAIDAGHLYFDNDTRQWRIDYKDGGNKPMLLAISSEEMQRSREVLIYHLIKDHKSLEMLENVMGDTLTKAASPLLEPEAVERTEDMAVLREQAKLLGINSFGKNRETLKEMIIAELTGTA